MYDSTVSTVEQNHRTLKNSRVIKLFSLESGHSFKEDKFVVVQLNEEKEGFGTKTGKEWKYLDIVIYLTKCGRPF